MAVYVFAFGNDLGDVLVAYSERHFGDYRTGRQNADNLGVNILSKNKYREAWKDWLSSEVGDTGSVTRSQMVKFGLNLPNDQRAQFTYLETDSDSADAWTNLNATKDGYDYVRTGKRQYQYRQPGAGLQLQPG